MYFLVFIPVITNTLMEMYDGQVYKSHNVYLGKECFNGRTVTECTICVAILSILAAN